METPLTRARTLGTANPEDVGLSREGLDRVDAAVQQHIDDGVIAGAVTLVARHSKVVRSSILGTDDLAAGKPLALDSIFRIFSMTKPITAVAMMILRDRGLWKPEERIAEHLPEFESLAVFAGLDDAGHPLLAEPKHPPTMAELMTHTAGFSYGNNPTDPVDKMYSEARLLRSSSLPALVDTLARLPLAYQPGTNWKYSVAMDVQGAIIERLSGQSLPAFFADHIFAPLGMVDTAFFTPPEKLQRRATLYYTGNGSRLQPVPNPLYDDPTTEPDLPMGGAGLVSTVGDYARFCQMLLNGGAYGDTRIVSATALQEMTTNHLSARLIDGGFGVGHMRIRPGFGFGYNGVVFYDPDLAGIPVGVGTYMWDGAAGTWFWVDPANDLLYVGMIQLLSLDSPPLQAITQTLLGAALAG